MLKEFLKVFLLRLINFLVDKIVPLGSFVSVEIVRVISKTLDTSLDYDYSVFLSLFVFYYSNVYLVILKFRDRQLVIFDSLRFVASFIGCTRASVIIALSIFVFPVGVGIVIIIIVTKGWVLKTLLDILGKLIPA